MYTLSRIDSLESIELKKWYVPSRLDKDIVEELQISETTIILEGNPGSGKTFLFKIAQANLLENFTQDSRLPIFVSFLGIVRIKRERLLSWVVAKIAKEIVTSLQRLFELSENDVVFKLFQKICHKKQKILWLEEYIYHLENDSNEPQKILLSQIKDWIRDICLEKKLKRIVLFFDNISNPFLLQQQFIFFDIVRDLRMEQLTFHATTYPTSKFYGDFNLTHDAFLRSLIRHPFDHSYVRQMIAILRKRTPENLFFKNSALQTLAILASGNVQMFLELSMQYFQAQENYFSLTLQERKNILHSIKNTTLQNLEKKLHITIQKTAHYLKEKNIVENIIKHHPYLECKSFFTRFPQYKKIIKWAIKFIDNLCPVLIKQQTSVRKKDSKINRSKKRKPYIFMFEKEQPVLLFVMRILNYFNIIQYLGDGFATNRNIYGKKYCINLGYFMTKLPNEEKLFPDSLSSRCYIHPNNSIIVEELNQIPASIEKEYINITPLLKKKISALKLPKESRIQLKKLKIETISQLLKISPEKTRTIKGIKEAIEIALYYLSGSF